MKVNSAGVAVPGLTWLLVMKGSQWRWKRSWRYCFVKQPTYDVKLAASSTSPGNVVSRDRRLHVILKVTNLTFLTYLNEDRY